MDDQDSVMHTESEGWPVWSDQRDELLLLVDAGSDGKVHHNLLYVVFNRPRPVKVPLLYCTLVSELQPVADEK